MSDARNDNEPVTGNDPTNGLAGDLEGDDGGAESTEQHRSLMQDIESGFDPDAVLEEGTNRVDGEDSATPYSEEGKP